MTEEYYTAKQVAAALQIHIDTVRRWIRSGKLEAHPTSWQGRREYRIPRSALAALGFGRLLVPKDDEDE
jgi:excisionase family DNA binding protein